MKFLNEYVAPWVLPNQAIPMHCVWVPEKNLAEIKVTIPEDYNLSETLNFVRYDYDEPTSTLSVSTKDLKSDNYFGVVLTCSKIAEEVEKRDEVSVHFISKDGTILGESVFRTRVVRPKLELLESPEKIVITDETDPNDLINLKILHRGFGTANLNVSIIHSDIDISKDSSLYLQVVRDVFERIFSSTLGDQETGSSDFEADEELHKSIAEELLIQTRRKTGILEIDEKQLSEVRALLKDETRREMIYRIIYSSLRSLLLAALLYYGERHPEEDIRLLYGKIVADMRDRVDELNIQIHYFDSLGNEYPPLESRIEVVDKRAFRGENEKFEAPVNIAWQRDILDLGER